MLPFLKNDKEASVSDVAPAEESEYGELDAVAEDMLAAFKAGDASLLKSALESYKSILQSEDIEQDEEILTQE